MDLKVYVLDGGRLVTEDASIFSADGNYKGEHWDMANPCYLVVHPRGMLMWDCGFSDSLADLPDGYNSGRSVWSLTRKVSKQLEDMAIDLHDIDYFALSHSHLDHSGNANLFKCSTWIVDEAEREFMFRDTARESKEFENYHELENAEICSFTADHDVFGDGSVVILRAPGHTPGHAALLVNLAKSGPVIFTGDLWYTCRCRTTRNIPSNNTDREQTFESMARIEGLARELGARIIIQHERADWNSMPRFPDYLQ
ncbi:N-acyl homoserine lactonase family protein [Sphingosinicella xenopeptidilytica]|uniref:N-acyl homoserine lactonase family protein n=1 Tax=Sphingosinicella xenopeptidilytica TaxID=364098 RepID=A0ABW3C5J0_SPHXN